MESCNGINLLAEIKKDLKPWSDKGGITARDIDSAEKALSKVEGYIRVSIIDGTILWHIGCLASFLRGERKKVEFRLMSHTVLSKAWQGC